MLGMRAELIFYVWFKFDANWLINILSQGAERWGWLDPMEIRLTQSQISSARAWAYLGKN